MTTFYNRSLRSQRGTSQQPQHFAPAPAPLSNRIASRIDWMTVLTFGAAAAALALVVTSAIAQRERLEKAVLDQSNEATLAAVTQAERDGYERALAEFSIAVQAAYRTGLIDALRSCGKI